MAQPARAPPQAPRNGAGPDAEDPVDAPGHGQPPAGGAAGRERLRRRRYSPPAVMHLHINQQMQDLVEGSEEARLLWRLAEDLATNAVRLRATDYWVCDPSQPDYKRCIAKLQELSRAGGRGLEVKRRVRAARRRDDDDDRDPLLSAALIVMGPVSRRAIQLGMAHLKTARTNLVRVLPLTLLLREPLLYAHFLPLCMAAATPHNPMHYKSVVREAMMEREDSIERSLDWFEYYLYIEDENGERLDPREPLDPEEIYVFKEYSTDEVLVRELGGSLRDSESSYASSGSSRSSTRSATEKSSSTDENSSGDSTEENGSDRFFGY